MVSSYAYGLAAEPGPRKDIFLYQSDTALHKLKAMDPPLCGISYLTAAGAECGRTSAVLNQSWSLTCFSIMHERIFCILMPTSHYRNLWSCSQRLESLQYVYAHSLTRIFIHKISLAQFKQNKTYFKLFILSVDNVIAQPISTFKVQAWHTMHSNAIHGLSHFSRFRRRRLRISTGDSSRQPHAHLDGRHHYGDWFARSHLHLPESQ